MENIQAAFLLLLIGMVMVFIVLWLVVGLGNLLVRLTNRYISEDKNSGVHSEITRIDKKPKKIAAIVAAVDIATQGQGRIDSINKNK